MKLPALLLGLLCLPCGVLATIRRDAVIVNACDEPIVVCHIDGTPNAKIEPRKEARIVFPPSDAKLPIKVKDAVYWYACPIPPHEFLKAGVFRSTFRLVFSTDRRLYLVPFDFVGSDIRTVQQPSGWPLSPATERPPNQALQHNDRDCHGLCGRTLRASHGRG